MPFVLFQKVYLNQIGSKNSHSNRLIKLFSLKKTGKMNIFLKKACRIKKFTLLLHRKNDGAIAQLVEQRTENPCVPGSIPGGTT